MRDLAMVLLAGTAVWVSCARATGPSEDIQIVKARHESTLLAIPGVVGVGIGECDGRSCIKVFVISLTPELTRRIPKRLDGYVVSIEVTGPIDARGR